MRAPDDEDEDVVLLEPSAPEVERARRLPLVVMRDPEEGPDAPGDLLWIVVRSGRQRKFFGTFAEFLVQFERGLATLVGRADVVGQVRREMLIRLIRQSPEVPQRGEVGRRLGQVEHRQRELVFPCEVPQLVQGRLVLPVLPPLQALGRDIGGPRRIVGRDLRSTTGPRKKLRLHEGFDACHPALPRAVTMTFVGDQR